MMTKTRHDLRLLKLSRDITDLLGIEKNKYVRVSNVGLWHNDKLQAGELDLLVLSSYNTFIIEYKSNPDRYQHVKKAHQQLTKAYDFCDRYFKQPIELMYIYGVNPFQVENFDYKQSGDYFGTKKTSHNNSTI